jgi:hypothetical protein
MQNRSSIMHIFLLFMHFASFISTDNWEYTVLFIIVRILYDRIASYVEVCTNEHYCIQFEYEHNDVNKFSLSVQTTVNMQ